MLDRVPAPVTRTAQSLDHRLDAGVPAAEWFEQTLAHRVPVVDAVLPHLVRQVGVDVVQPHVTDAARGELEDLERVGSQHDEVTRVEAEPGIGADQEPLDVGRTLNHGAEPRQHRQPESMTSAHMLDRTDEVEEMRPARAVEHDPVHGARAARSDRGQHERLAADRREPTGVTIDVRELRAANVMVMEDRMRLTGYDPHPMAPDQELGLVASIGEESGRPGLDRRHAKRPHL